MEAVGQVDIGMRRRAEHRTIAVGRAGEAVGCGVARQIGFRLDNDAANAGNAKFGADQVGGDRDGVARKETVIPLQSIAPPGPCQS